MLGINLKGVEAAGGTMIEAGGYIIKITKVSNDTAKQRMEFEFDIDEGPFKGYYAERKERLGWWPAKFYKYYSVKAQSFFKAFVETIESCNGGAPGLVVEVTDENGEPQEDVDESKFVGCRIGMIFGMEEKYSEKNGRVYDREDFFNAKFVPIGVIESGEYAVPEKKTLPAAQGCFDVVDTTEGFEPLKDNDVQF